MSKFSSGLSELSARPTCCEGKKLGSLKMTSGFAHYNLKVKSIISNRYLLLELKYLTITPNRLIARTRFRNSTSHSNLITAIYWIDDVLFVLGRRRVPGWNSRDGVCRGARKVRGAKRYCEGFCFESVIRSPLFHKSGEAIAPRPRPCSVVYEWKVTVRNCAIIVRICFHV